MKPPKRRPTKTASPPPAATVAVRLGFSPEARAAFDRLSLKVSEGLRKKLRAYGENPAIGKPLVGALAGYHRVTYGRVRSIAKAVEAASIVRSIEGVVIVHVLWVGPRKGGSRVDPYEVAAAALRAADPEAVELLQNFVRGVVQGASLDADDDAE